MSTAIHGQGVETAIAAGRHRDDIVVGGEIVRHRRITRVIHWTVALTFFVSVFSGMPIWSPLFTWMAYLLGGLEAARLIHPWAGVAFFVMSTVQFFHWLGEMIFRSDERGWWRPSTLMSYMRYDEEANWGGGKYNPGQKLFFWAVTLGALVLLVSGIVMWFPIQFAPILRELSYLLHDVTFIFFMIAIMFHIYLGTAAEPGTFRAMTRGTVTRSWARLHHPGWFGRLTGTESRRD